TLTQGSACRRRASSSPARVSSFSAFSRSSLPFSHSSRVAVGCVVVTVAITFSFPFEADQQGKRARRAAAEHHPRRGRQAEWAHFSRVPSAPLRASGREAPRSCARSVRQ